MNRVILTGRLTADPELKFLPGDGKGVCSFTIAVERKYKNKDGEKEADFIRVNVWGKSAEHVANYMTKGRMVGIDGKLKTGNYEDKDGNKRYFTEVVAEEVQFLDYKKDGQENQNSNIPDDITPVDDGSIPF